MSRKHENFKYHRCGNREFYDASQYIFYLIVGYDFYIKLNK